MFIVIIHHFESGGKDAQQILITILIIMQKALAFNLCQTCNVYNFVFVCERERERTVIISLLILTYFMIQFYLMLIGDYHV